MRLRPRTLSCPGGWGKRTGPRRATLSISRQNARPNRVGSAARGVSLEDIAQSRVAIAMLNSHLNTSQHFRIVFLSTLIKAARRIFPILPSGSGPSPDTRNLGDLSVSAPDSRKFSRPPHVENLKSWSSQIREDASPSEGRPYASLLCFRAFHEPCRLSPCPKFPGTTVIPSVNAIRPPGGPAVPPKAAQASSELMTHARRPRTRHHVKPLNVG